MKSWLNERDVVFTCENFTDTEFFVPGFRVIVGRSRNASRGGVAFLIRNYLYSRLATVDLSVEEQIWIKFDFMSDVLFGGCYIAPINSVYYSESDMAMIQSKCIEHNSSKYIFFGDLNSKCGGKISDLIKNIPNCSYSIPYNSKADKGGNQLRGICSDLRMTPVNGLLYQYRDPFL